MPYRYYRRGYRNRRPANRTRYYRRRPYYVPRKKPVFRKRRPVSKRAYTPKAVKAAVAAARVNNAKVKSAQLGDFMDRLAVAASRVTMLPTVGETTAPQKVEE
jgi:hypothetical protein